MPVFLSSDVQRRPFAIPVERYRLVSFVEVIELLEVVILDCSRTIFVEESESDFIFSVWFGQEIFEGCPIVQIDAASLSSICNAKKDRVLLSLDLVLCNH